MHKQRDKITYDMQKKKTFLNNNQEQQSTKCYIRAQQCNLPDIAAFDVFVF